MILLVNLITYLEIMDKYNWFENHEGDLGFTVRHTEGDVETLIAVTDTAEKAHLIVTMLNNQPGDEELIPAVELLKPYRKQSRNGVLDWVSHEDAVKVLHHQQVQFHLLKQIYDDAILQWKLLDTKAKDIMETNNELRKSYRDVNARNMEIAQLKEEEIRDLQKQIDLKELSNATLLLQNRDLNKWKEEAMIVMKDIPEIGRSIGVPLGETIHDKILPYITTLQASFKDRVLIIEKQLKEKEDLFPGAFLWWVHSNGWHKHSSGEYYYKSKDFHQWPPDESITIEDLKVQFKAAYKL